LYAAHRSTPPVAQAKTRVPLQLVEAEKRTLDLVEARGLVPLRHSLVAREPKQVLS
jgi:hypothetical protein